MYDSATGYRKTTQYCRYLMEQHLGRQLEKWEQVDHIDGDFTNDDLSNLQVLDKRTHLYLDAVRVEPITLICDWCGSQFTRRAADHAHNKKMGRAGAFCSKSCVGKYGAYIQNGGTPFEVPEVPDRVYYTNKERKLEKA